MTDHSDDRWYVYRELDTDNTIILLNRVSAGRYCTKTIHPPHRDRLLDCTPHLFWNAMRAIADEMLCNLEDMF